MSARFCWISTIFLAVALLLFGCQSRATPTPVEVTKVAPTRASPGIPLTAPTEARAAANPIPHSAPTARPLLPITAREAYALAESRAKAWNANAMLYVLSSENEEPIEQSLAANGRAKIWHLIFIDSIPDPSQGYASSITISVGPQGVISDPRFDQQSFDSAARFILMTDWTVDSPEALAAVEAGGGSVFRKKYPDTIFAASLGKPWQESQAQVAWIIQYLSPSAPNDPLEVVLDAGTGQFVPELSKIPEWMSSVPFAEMQTLTTRDGYALAEQAARSWNPNAALVFAVLDDIDHQKVTLSGRGPAWKYTFVDTGSADPSKPAMLDIRVGPQGVISTLPAESYSLPAPLSSLSRWVLDSPQAVAVAENAGGAIYRGKCPGASIRAGLIMLALEPSGTYPAVWMVSYSDPTCGVDSLIAYVDAATGAFLPQWSQVPEWASSVPTTGQSSLTAMAGLRLAIERAQTWQPGAALHKICSDSINPDGRADTWSYTFLPNPGSDEYAKVRALVVKVRTNGTLVTSFEDVNTQTRIRDWTAVNLDSPQVLQTAEDGGGKDLRAQYPDARIAMCLEMESFNSASDTERILWQVSYADPGGNISRRYYIEDASRRIQQMRNAYLDRALNAPPISARAAYESGLRFAQGWNWQATLARLDTSFPSIPAVGALTIDGKAPLWKVLFVAPLPGGNTAKMGVLSVTVSSRGIEEYYNLEMAPTSEPFDIHLWAIDTLQAMNQAEAYGGYNLRAANPGKVSVYASLEMTSEVNPHRLVWVISYIDPNGTQDFVIDATTGEYLSSDFTPR